MKKMMRMRVEWLCRVVFVPLSAGSLMAEEPVEAQSEADDQANAEQIAPQQVTEPAWWQHPEYRLKRSGAKPNNHGVLNLGQLKNMAAACAREFDQSLPGGAGPAIHSMIRRWSDPENKTNNYAVANTGQLKSVTKMFYDRLIAEGYASEYPWAHATEKPNHYAVALIGQLKHLFNFDIERDADSDGLADMWELTRHGNLDQLGRSGTGGIAGFNCPNVDPDPNRARELNDREADGGEPGAVPELEEFDVVASVEGEPGLEIKSARPVTQTR